MKHSLKGKEDNGVLRGAHPFVLSIYFLDNFTFSIYPVFKYAPFIEGENPLLPSLNLILHHSPAPHYLFTTSNIHSIETADFMWGPMF